MRFRSALLSTFAMTLLACSWTSEGGITGLYESKEETIVSSAEGSWNNEPISFGNSAGSIQIVGVPGKTNISVYARLTAGANSQTDADAAFADAAKSIVVAKDIRGWTVNCGSATEWHGSADPLATGCSSIRVEIPAGTREAPLSLSAKTAFGGIHASGVTVGKLDLEAPFGLVADVTPVLAADLRLWGNDLASGLCSSILRVPAESTIGTATLTVDNPTVEYVDADPNDPTYWLGTYVEGFANAPALPPRQATYVWTKGAAPFDTFKAQIHASLGKAILTTAAVPAYHPIHECEKMKSAKLEIGP